MRLIFQDGTVFEGESFGADVNVAGEVVFSTGMTGYVEAFTDPSFAGQILVCTYPLIGNYGVPYFAKASKGETLTGFESEKMQIAGLVVANYSENYSHHDAVQSLADWCKASGVPAIQGVDTRAITKKLREKGVMLGKLVNPALSPEAFLPVVALAKSGAKGEDFFDPNTENLVPTVSPKEVRTYGDGPIRIVLIDCGAKENIVRSLIRSETTVVRVPWDYDFNMEEYRALVLSNGPGDPTMCGPTIEHIKKAMAAGKPILGVCLGNQLLALAAGAKTYKLPYGHRGQNIPCIDVLGGRPDSAPDSAKATTGKKASTGKCYITSQNHGFAVDEKSLPQEWKAWFTNGNDGSNEGIAHVSKPWRSVQFHPEANPGPTDTAWIFDRFLEDLIANKI